MSEYIQKGYIRIADIIPIWDDIRIADIPTLAEIVWWLEKEKEGHPPLSETKILNPLN